MTIKEIVEQSKLYFGKNRQRLKKTILAFDLDGKEYRLWNKQIKQITTKPFEIRYGMFDDVVEWLKQKKFSEIDWRWLGDLSWEFKFLLNSGIEKGFDWDKKLALNCGGTARILKIYVSDIVPCFVTDVYYMTYSKKENYWEFGPIEKLSAEEQKFADKAKMFFRDKGFTFLSKKEALMKHEALYSDCKSYGIATLFDVLFSDTENYQHNIKRFNDAPLRDPTGKSIHWNENYEKIGKLKLREEYRYYDSKNVECVVTDSLGQIVEVKVWRDIDKLKHSEFRLDILAQHKRNTAKTKAKVRTN